MHTEQQKQIDEIRAREKTWTTSELQADFDVVGFLAPFVEVIRKSDGVRGSMMFCASPRFYYDFRGA